MTTSSSTLNPSSSFNIENFDRDGKISVLFVVRGPFLCDQVRFADAHIKHLSGCPNLDLSMSMIIAPLSLGARADQELYTGAG